MKRLLTLLILITTILMAKAENNSNYKEDNSLTKFALYSQLLSPEKLYLHTDREQYKSGDTIWFKGYLTNNSKLYEYPISNFIYVELFSSMVEKDYNKGTYVEDSKLRKRVKIKRDSSGFSGYLPIPSDLTSGIATLRGYT